MAVSKQTAKLALGAMRAVWRIGNEQAGRVPPAAVERWQTAFAELEVVASTPERTASAPRLVAVPSFEEIDVAEAARRLGITRRAVQKRCATGSLPARRVGRSWLINWSEAEAA